MQAERVSRTAGVCSPESRVGCPLDGRQLCRHTPRGMLDFGLLAVGFLIPFVAGMILSGYWFALVLWLLLAAVFFGYVEAMVLCRHCPHYAGRRLSLVCHASHGLAPVSGFSLRPLSRREEIAFFSYLGVLGLYHVPFFVMGRQWALLLIASGALAVWCSTLLRTQCTHCCHVFCPVNRVPEAVRTHVFEYCPVLGGVGRGLAVVTEPRAEGGDGGEGR